MQWSEGHARVLVVCGGGGGVVVKVRCLHVLCDLCRQQKVCNRFLDKLIFFVNSASKKVLISLNYNMRNIYLLALFYCDVDLFFT